MSDDDITTTGESTRRDYLTYGGAVVGGTLLAGCAGPSDESDSGADSGESDTGADSGARDASYSVSMEPMGTVEFESVPETIAPFTADYIDMLVALGKADAVRSIWYRGRYKTNHYDELDGVSVDLDGLTQLWNDGVSKELFYEMDADLHLIDPHSLTDWLAAWDQSDVDEVRDNVAPFLGNLIFRRTDDWHDYRYYSLYEAFEKVAAAVQERERFEAIRSIHDDLVATVRDRLPPQAERPDAALMFAGKQPEEFTPYRISGEGANKEHFHAVGIEDAFEGTGVEGYTGSESLDYETLLEIDPDALLLRYHGRGMSRSEFEETVVAYLEDHDLGSELTAVQEGRVFRGGPIYAGPLHNLFMIDRYATGLYPDRFEDERLFDRQRLADIINGDA
ncbi:Fe3+-hydroxamate ABC transporter substrate-binding protein [Halorubrum sp. Atlit-8R]|nr:MULTISPECIES: ABC transporter substrate-binding protein [unclassified Halorubrum]RLM71325.1 Fe3+-hydroxamate ABC transporter substrate-binding protein [Halorubrum sp. Atlit-9R]RLM72193.1 Fe3+-hydroxamate ABC transporter substrate-binding protein [Halorubrum sp. Atlit-9R]RLM82522.1 Fe3+-hydroxamate ABC transporter substrate-binding protein [Halorubrum sp. Atlit-8R]TKX57350.1 Fe3+-hydroxamate ABC transporter substrate-binding protein [Halorubrum sp. SS7]